MRPYSVQYKVFKLYPKMLIHALNHGLCEPIPLLLVQNLGTANTLNTYIHTYIHAYIHTYIHTYII